MLGGGFHAMRQVLVLPKGCFVACPHLSMRCRSGYGVVLWFYRKFEDTFRSHRSLLPADLRPKIVALPRYLKVPAPDFS